jgi:P pilus assembly chaperone PapD
MKCGLRNTFIQTLSQALAGKRHRFLGFSAAVFFTCSILLTSGAAPASAQISATPSIARFASVPVGTTNTQALQLKNTGGTSVTVFSIGLLGTDFSLSGERGPFVLAPGATVHLTVAFSPAAAQSYSGSIAVTSTAPGRLFTILLSGSGSSSTKALTPSPASLSFGNVMIGVLANADISLHNTGNSNITISSVSLSGTEFSITGVSAGTTITPGQSAVLIAEFSPKTAGSTAASIKVVSNAGTMTIPVTGDGVSTATHSVDLKWGGSSSSGVVGYNVYRSTSSGSGYEKIVSSVPITSYLDQSVQAGVTYYYVVTSVSSAGAESGYSNQTSAPVP